MDDDDRDSLDTFIRWSQENANQDNANQNDVNQNDVNQNDANQNNANQNDANHDNANQDDRDSLDSFIQQSQADINLRQENESFADLSVDLTPNSKVNQWLVATRPKPIENKENYPVARRLDINQNRGSFQVVRKENTGPLEQMNLLAQQRQEIIFKLLSREQDLDEQRIDAIKKAMAKKDMIKKHK